jgi:hypothetical protein
VPIVETKTWGYGPFLKIARILRRDLKPGQGALFHCKAGKSRSPSVAIVFCEALNATTEPFPSDRYGRYQTHRRLGRIPPDIVAFARLAYRHPEQSVRRLRQRLEAAAPSS